MKKIRVALAQINSTVGDLTGNVKKIISYIRRAKRAGADIVVFPELAVTGYPRGAITPFGSKRALPVICDISLEGEVSLGGGAHGMSIHLDTADLVALTQAQVADVTKQAD